MLCRVVERRIGRDAGEQCRLSQRQPLRTFVEIRACGLLDPVGAVPEVDRVEVGEKDAILRPDLLELPGECRFSDFPSDRLFVADVGVLDELLRNRRATLDDAFGLDVLYEGACHAAGVNAVVFVEPLILDRDDRLAHDRGDVGDVSEEHAALLTAKDREHRAAIRRVDHAIELGALRCGVEERDLARDSANQTE